MLAALVILVVVLVFAWKGLSQPFFGLLGLITVFEVQPGELYPVLAPLHLERTLAALVLISFLARGGKFLFPTVTKRFLLFFGSMILSIPLAFWPGNTFWACIGFASIVYYHLMLVATIKTVAELRRVILLIIGLAAWLGASADYAYHNGARQVTMGIERAEGLTSSGGDPNTLANTMVITLPLMWMMMMLKSSSKWTRIYAFTCVATAFLTIVITGSRTGFIALLLLLLMLVFRQKRNLKFLPVLILAMPLFWLVIPQQYKARYESVKTREEDQSYTDRLLSWQGGVRMFLHNPVTGIGADNYALANGALYWPATPRVSLNAHSLYFKLIGELGSVGVLSFVAYLFAVVATNLRLGRRFREQGADPLLAQFPSYCNLIMILLLFTGYSGHNLYRSNWYTMGAITGALSLMSINAPALAQPQRGNKGGARPAWIPQDSTSVEPVTIEAGPLPR